jgi:hypothetical protein
MQNKTTKFHPILFSTPMVQAIDKNIKTKTRRTKGLEKVNLNPNDWKFEGIAAVVHFPTEKNDLRISQYFTNKQTGLKEHAFCPYELGDVFWVRETFRPIEQEIGLPRFEYKSSEKINLGDKWKPSIFMPKEACRTFLKIKSIRVERLQDISEEDAQAEGAHFLYHGLGTVIIDSHPDWEKLYKPRASYKDGFHYIWKYINGEESWQFNPYVFVYEFEKIEKPLDFI